MTERLQLPSYVQSGMILQQEDPFVLCGQAKPYESIRISLERLPLDQRVLLPLDHRYGRVFEETVQTDETGRFCLSVPSPEASFDPHQLTVACADTSLTFEHILYGEVWVAAGQSNMQMPLSAVMDLEDLEQLAQVHGVRVLSQAVTGIGRQQPGYPFEPARDLCEARWLYGDRPEEMAQVSAVGFSFARALHLSLQVPVALLETALGGSCIHAWLRRETVEETKAIRQHVIDLGFYRDESNWDTSRDWEEAQYQPAALYNSKVAPLKGLCARGVLWYQGESDYRHPDYYACAFPKLVDDWHRVFRPSGKRDLAFLVLQLAPYFYGHPSFYQLALFNECLAALRHNLPSPMAVLPLYDQPLAFDQAPEDWRHPLHPTAKTGLGQHLKRLAEGLVYGRKGPRSAPECVQVDRVGNKMLLSFSDIGDGLMIKNHQDRLRGFAVCGKDRVFVQAQARLLYGVRVMVWSDQVADPQAVTYAFSDMNQEANLISRDQLPVVPFRSDRFKASYLPPMEWLHCEALEIWACPALDRLEETGWHPSWRTVCGHCTFRVERHNKTEGAGSLHLRYQTDDQKRVVFEPALDLASLFPPLDLGAIGQIHIQFFNPNRWAKQISLTLVTAGEGKPRAQAVKAVTVKPELQWQPAVFVISHMPDKDQVRQLLIQIEDDTGSGELYMDQIELYLDPDPGKDGQNHG